MTKQFHQIQWDDRLRADWRAILRLAVREDLEDAGDWTTRAIVPEDVLGAVAIVARQPGVVAGLAAVETTLEYFDARAEWLPDVQDGQSVRQGERLGRIEGPAAGLLGAERLVLNLLGRLSGIATLTARYVRAVQHTRATIYDTRKTTPGWRRLEKYAVRCGGGCNHRTGLFEAVLIKDNHLALGAQPSLTSRADTPASFTPAEAVVRARRYIEVHVPEPVRNTMIVEVEVDTLEQLEEVLPLGPDIVLLDNMSPAELGEAVARRDALAASVELEASGGVDLPAVGEIAKTGVDRISVGALTHSAVWLDVAMDWLGPDRV